MENEAFHGKTCCKIISPKPMEWATMKTLHHWQKLYQ
jgi:hypothetical protein